MMEYQEKFIIAPKKMQYSTKWNSFWKRLPWKIEKVV